MRVARSRFRMTQSTKWRDTLAHSSCPGKHRLEEKFLPLHTSTDQKILSLLFIVFSPRIRETKVVLRLVVVTLRRQLKSDVDFDMIYTV